MIGYDFGMHQTGVLLHLLLIVILIRAIEVNRPYLDDRYKRQRTNQN